ncbi:hypothetical protein AAFN85_00530 [Mucilaginibacter sp. CAU 1740]|uniref:hypothetical protein n=1 Tax=Mucilaginibacter sp. CAU 1740 TaxID=3140365 RepID=UPI00325AF877
MKIFLPVTLIAFITITLITMQNHAASDGMSNYGFPKTFYSFTSGKTIYSYGVTYHFLIINFLIDIVFAMIFGLIAVAFINRKKKLKRVSS